jgi:hypothetical protein
MIKCIGGNPKKINIAKEGEEPKYLKIVNCWDDMTIVEAISLQGVFRCFFLEIL